MPNLIQPAGRGSQDRENVVLGPSLDLGRWYVFWDPFLPDISKHIAY